jgi:hypothetical protein
MREGANGERRRGRLRALDVVTLASVATVVLLVSLPRLRDLALRENESDARRLAERLGAILVSQAGTNGLATRARGARDVVESEPLLARELGDLEYLEGGSLVRRHGYLFDIVTEESGLPLAVRAWPCVVGRSGERAFVWSAERGLLAHPNRGRWSGAASRPPAAPAELGLDPGWRRP